MEPIIWNVDPVLLSFGSLKVHWYGLIFAAAMFSGFHIMNYIYKKEKKSVESLESLFIYILIGIVVGARLGHCFFYDPEFYLNNPLKIIAVWEGGLASHGGGLGAMLGSYLYAKKHKINYLWLLDKLAIPTAVFAFFVRMGNLMNSEILGVQTNVAWAVVFSRVDNIPRHPAQLYEAISYLLISFVLFMIYIYTKKEANKGYIFGMFLSLVFSARFLIEFVKSEQSAYSTVFISTGQMLSIPFLILGIILIQRSLKTKN